MNAAEYDAIAARAEAAADSRGAIDQAVMYRIELSTSMYDRISASQRDVATLLAALRERDTTITTLQDALTVAREECRYADLDAKVNCDTANRAEATVARVRDIIESVHATEGLDPDAHQIAGLINAALTAQEST